jgi:glutamyl-tRNA reductase
VESYKVITVTHKTTHVSKLKDYLLSDGDSGFPVQRLTEMKESLQLQELYYLNTCNRITFFFVSDRPVDRAFLSGLFSFINPAFNESLLDMHLRSAQVYEGEAAVRHLFDVASSLDSLVVGEKEILRQLKEAYTACRKHGLCGDNIRLAIEQAVVLAKRICTETRLGERPVSVVSLAFREMLQTGVDKEVPIVMIGAGQTNNLLSNLLIKYGFSQVTVFNRSADKAMALAAKLGGRGYSLSQIMEVQVRPQVIITCTGSHDPIVDVPLMKHWGIDPQLPVTIVDLGVPANVDIQVIARYLVNYIHVGGLEKIAEENRAFRQHEMQHAEELIADFMGIFRKLHRERQLERAMGEIPGKVKALRKRTLDVFKKDLNALDPQSREVLEKMMDYMEQKYVGMPYKIAKRNLLQLDIPEKS